MRYLVLTCMVAAFALALIGNAGVEALFPLAGLLFVVGLVIWVTKSRWFRRVVPPMPAMENLFPAVGGLEWCAVCGHAVAPKATCSSCDAPLRSAAKRRRKRTSKAK